MKRRPWILVVLAVVHVCAPAGNLLMNAAWAHIPFWRYIEIFFQPWNLERQWPHLVIPVLAGIAIYLCRSWSFWVYLLCMCVLFTLSYFGYKERAGSVSLAWLITVYVANIAVVGYFLLPAVRAVYMDPRLRWWQTKPRYKADIQARCRDLAAPEFSAGHVVNFSEGGLFLKSDWHPADHSTIQVLFDFQGEAYEFTGEVIHHQQRLQQGFGVKFIESAASRSRAKKVTAELGAMGLLIKDRSPAGDEHFLNWLKRLMKTGKGFFPEHSKKS
jgi:hypothetical protein